MDRQLWFPQSLKKTTPTLLVGVLADVERARNSSHGRSDRDETKELLISDISIFKRYVIIILDEVLQKYISPYARAFSFLAPQFM